MKSRKTIFGLFACALVGGAFLCGSVHSEMIDRTVATVNGDIILYSDLQEQIKVMEMVAPDLKSAPPEKRAEIEKDILQQLIRQRLTEQEVKRLKVAVTSAEVDHAIEDIKKENNFTQAQFEASLKKSGITLPKLRDSIKKELERNRLLERVLRMKTVITEQQVDAYLKGKPAETTASREGAQGAAGGVQGVRLGVIYLPVDPKKGNTQEVEKTGREVLSKIKGGADFGKMASQYSKGPAAAEGGDVGLMTADEIAPHIAGAIKGLNKGQVSELVKGPEGYYIVKVLGFETKQQQQTTVSKSDGDPRERARRELYNKELERKFNEWVQSLESKAFIQISL
ncbi:MAG: SurA N-terminal domain-containing protein [Syntrophobacter sp.]